MIEKRVAASLLVLVLGCAGHANESATNENGKPRKFVVMLEGRNFIFEDGGRPTRLGFFTTKHIVAANGEEAKSLAIKQIREDETLNGSTLNARSNPPRVVVTNHIEVESFASDGSPGLGYIFYEDHDTN